MPVKLVTGLNNMQGKFAWDDKIRTEWDIGTVSRERGRKRGLECVGEQEWGWFQLRGTVYVSYKYKRCHVRGQACPTHGFRNVRFHITIW